LLLILSYEVFSYESEKIVILCIITFLILAYFTSKESLADFFAGLTFKMQDNYASLLNEKEEMELRVRNF